MTEWKKLTKEQELRLHKGVTGTYKGDLVSDVVYSLSKKYLKGLVLDAGAGTGSFVRKLWSKGITAVGIDICPKTDYVLKADLDYLESKSFDSAVSMDVLEHLNDKELHSYMKNLNRVLKKGSYFIATTLIEEDLEAARVTCPDCGFRFHRVGHCHSFSVFNLRNLFEMYGFEIVEERRMNLTLYSMFPNLMKVFFGLGMNRLLRNKMLSKDILIVARRKR